MSDALHQLETVTEGDTARETVIRLSVRGREMPDDIEIESAILRVDGDTVQEITLTENDDGDWYFRWTDEHFTALPASDTEYEAQVKVTFDDDSIAYFPTTGRIKIKVNEPI